MNEIIIMEIAYNYSVYKMWEIGVEDDDYDLIDKTKDILYSRCFNVSDELINMGYLERVNDECFKLGSNKSNDTMLEIAKVYTSEFGLVDDNGNDYYELANALYGVLVKECFNGEYIL